MLPIAISPCPNDTFLFWAWIHGMVGAKLPIQAHYADIETLNRFASEEKFPLIKVSIHTYAEIQDRYELLNIGAALGYGVGPKVISKKLNCDLSEASVAIPGQKTTAHFLFDLFFQAKEKIFCPYHEIISLICNDHVEAGVIIHESRFTFQREGLQELADLGKLWEKKFRLPLPLGGLALHRDCQQKELIISILRDSFCEAQKKKEEMFEFILSLSQEKRKEVVQNHIDLYVNDETFNLSSQGQKAIDKFLELKRETSHFCNLS